MADDSSSIQAPSKGCRPTVPETRIIAVGDRLHCSAPDNKRRGENGEYAIITSLDNREIEVRFDKCRKVSMPLSEARKVDLSYASTSHAAQGATFDRAVLNIDSSRSAELVNSRSWYVG